MCQRLAIALLTFITSEFAAELGRPAANRAALLSTNAAAASRFPSRCGTIHGLEVELFDNRARILDVFGVEAVGAHHDAIGPHQVDQETQSFRMIGEIVVMESPQVFLER